MITDFGRVLIFLIVGVVFVAGGMIFAWLLRPSRPYPSKLATYECGEVPLGDKASAGSRSSRCWSSSGYSL